VKQVDTMVIGLGTTGAAAARALARQGIGVLGVDAAPLDRAGARWRNGVPEATLRTHDLPVPDAPLAIRSTAFHLVAGWGPQRLTVRDHALLDVDMPWLVARLQDDAREAGAELRGGVRVRGLARDGDAHVVELDGETIRARRVVDCGGLVAPSLAQRPDRSWLCVAAQQDRELADPEGARRWLEAQGVADGETVSFAGVAGGFSIVNLAVHLPDDHGPGEVHVLTGSIPGLGNPAGPVLLERLVAEHPWIGERRSGGSRAIPLIPPEPVPGRDGLVRLGDAAGQVYAAHGSGIAAGLDAADDLARVWGGGGDAWDFTVSWQREHGGRLASSAVFARYSAGLSAEDLRVLMRAGLMQPALVRDGLHQASPNEVDPRVLPGLLLGALRAPAYALRMAPVVAAMRKVESLHARFPDEPSAVPAWSSARDAVFQRLG